MHLKRQKSPKNWPIYRKGTKYVVRPSFDIGKGIPVLIALRDMLGVVQNRKEAKRAIFNRNILLNEKPVLDEKNTILLLDVLKIVPSKKSYRMGLSGKGKFIIEEIDEKGSYHKVAKVVDKKILKNKKIQLNLDDGRNFLSDIKCKTNDSVLIDFKKNSVEKCIPLKEGLSSLVFAGKHSGKKGTIKNIDKEKKMVELDCDGNLINVLIKQIMVLE